MTCNLGYRRNWGSWDFGADGSKERERGHIWWGNVHRKIHTWCAASGEHSEPRTTQTGKEKALRAPFEQDYENSSRDDWSIRNMKCFSGFSLGFFREYWVDKCKTKFCEIPNSSSGGSSTWRWCGTQNLNRQRPNNEFLIDCGGCVCKLRFVDESRVCCLQPHWKNFLSYLIISYEETMAFILVCSLLYAGSHSQRGTLHQSEKHP